MEGALSRSANCQYYSFHILQNVGCADTKNFISCSPHHSISGNVAFMPITAIMRLSINFDYEPSWAAVKIGDVRAYWMLSTEFDALSSRTQLLPKQNLGQAHFAAKFPSAINHRALHWRSPPSTTLRVVPLPRFAVEDHPRRCAR